MRAADGAIRVDVAAGGDLGGGQQDVQAAAAGQERVERRAANRIVTRYHDALDVAFALLPVGPPPRRRHRQVAGVAPCLTASQGTRTSMLGFSAESKHGWSLVD